MTDMKGLRFAVVLLVILNVATLALLFHIRTEHGGPHREGPKRIVIERLHLDEDQVSAYEDLIVWHKDAISQKEEELMAARTSLYQALKTSDRGELERRLATVSSVQQEIESIHIAHFEQLGELCRGEQQQMFDELLDDLASYFSHGRGGARRPMD